MLVYYETLTGKSVAVFLTHNSKFFHVFRRNRLSIIGVYLSI